MTLTADVDIRLSPTFRLQAKLSLDSGSVTALVGANGAGKTTLLRALAGLQRLDDGIVVLDDRTLDNPSRNTFVPAAQRPIGVAFHDCRLFPHMNALDNVAFSLRNSGHNRESARRQARVWLERLNIAQYSLSKPSELSAGQTQRVALARALVHQPQLLLLDEPLAALDDATRADMRAVLADYLASSSGICLIITHDPLDANLASETIILDNGQVVDHKPQRVQTLVVKP